MDGLYGRSTPVYLSDISDSNEYVVLVDLKPGSELDRRLTLIQQKLDAIFKALPVDTIPP